MGLRTNALAVARDERLPTVSLLGARITALDEHQIVAFFCEEIAAGRGGWVFTMNLDHLRRFVKGPVREQCHRLATIITPDGMPLLWASRLQGTPVPDRVSGADLILSMTAAAARRDYSIFLIGGDGGAAEATAATLRQMHPGLRIAGINSAWFEADGSSPAMDALVDELRRTRPDVVFVGIGSPKSERITERLRARVGTVMPSTWWIGVGISFSFISGQIPRAPHWMQRSGLEWVHRLCQEPRRLAKRYLVEGLPFALTLFARSWIRRWRPAAPHEE